LVTLRGDLKFELRGNLPIAKEMTTLISATAVMMTFGFRNYRLPNLEKFIIYPDPYYSELGQRLHKGEYSPALKTVIFYWENVLKGFEINNDNINLALHEFNHVVHLRCQFWIQY
jgi:Mlc titration factor MtfA (ptsG expression regulator)